MNRNALYSHAPLTRWRGGTPDKARSEPTTSDFSFLRRILIFKLENISKRFFKSWQIAKSVISDSKFALVWVSLLFGIFFTFFSGSLSCFPDGSAYSGRAQRFLQSDSPFKLCPPWMESKGAAPCYLPSHQHLLSLAYSLFRHCVIGWKDREVGWAQNSKIN